MGMIVCALIVLGKFTELPKRNMFAYQAKDMDEAVARHMKLGGKMPKRVWQWGGMFYMDTEGTDGDKTD